MKYYIAIDAGGNKTNSVLFDQTGKVLARDLRRGANAFDVGPAEASARICGAIDVLTDALPAGERISGVYGSVSAAHYYPEIARRAARSAGGAPCKIEGVVYSVMASVLGREDGVCLIAGTGSYAAARKGDKPMFYLGSSGYMLDTFGSGFVLGREALVAAQRERDGRYDDETILTQIVERDMGESVIDHLPVIYAGGRAYVSSFAHAVFEARAQGDAVATKIFDDAVDAFAEAMNRAYDYMGGPYRAAVGGGLFLHYPEYLAALRAKAPHGCELVLADVPAVYGAALEAIWLGGDEAVEGFKKNFLASYRQQENMAATW